MKESIIPRSKRIEYIDIAKGLGIILVVIGHCLKGNTFPATWIWSFHMPLFFILSGLCFAENKYPTFQSFLTKRIKTLLLPCIYFSILIALLYVPIKGLSTFYSLFTDGLPGALWFILVLFFCELIYYLINKYSANTPINISTLFICLIIGIILNRYSIKLSHSMCSVFTATFYYGLGHIMKNKINILLSMKCKVIFSAILLAIPCAFVLITKQSINLADNYIPSPEAIYVLVSIIGSTGLLLLAMVKNNNKIWGGWILFLGKNTLIILSLHMFFIGVASEYIKPLIQNKLIYKLSEQIFVWTLLYFSIILINKKVKWILGK